MEGGMETGHVIGTSDGGKTCAKNLAVAFFMLALGGPREKSSKIVP